MIEEPNAETPSADAIDEEKKYLPYVWHLLEGDEFGSLPSRQIGRVMRAFGKNPSEQDIQYLKYEQKIDDDQNLLYNEFVTLHRACATGVDSKERLMDAFKVFDKENKGKMKPDDLRDILTRLGEPLSNTEVDKMLQLAIFDRNGSINYKDFCELVMSDNRPRIRT
ncbi:uncharacterized protein LOC128216430 [Mya arenaria]|nr:uncharacterized protein LOC128216420 [Mya arenaria]XP_052778954.1 uncharacterized protein LOC128216430 [Mya arenaria]